MLIIGQRQEELSAEASNNDKFLEMYRSVHGIFRQWEVTQAAAVIGLVSAKVALFSERTEASSPRPDPKAFKDPHGRVRPESWVHCYYWFVWFLY